MLYLLVWYLRNEAGSVARGALYCIGGGTVFERRANTEPGYTVLKTVGELPDLDGYHSRLGEAGAAALGVFQRRLTPAALSFSDGR